MLDKLKQQPLIGLTLAITCGYVLAHAVIKSGDALYENDPGLLITLGLAALAAAAIAWKRKVILAWLQSLRSAPAQTKKLSPNARLALEFMKADAEAALGRGPVSGEPEPGTEARYFQDVDDAIRMMGDRGTLAIYSQTNMDFLKASMKLREVGFECAVPATLVGGFIADAAVKYQSNSNAGVLQLEQTTNSIPRLWPDVTEPALRTLLAQLTSQGPR